MVPGYSLLFCELIMLFLEMKSIRAFLTDTNPRTALENDGERFRPCEAVVWLPLDHSRV